MIRMRDVTRDEDEVGFCRNSNRETSSITSNAMTDEYVTVSWFDESFFGLAITLSLIDESGLIWWSIPFIVLVLKVRVTLFLHLLLFLSCRFETNLFMSSFWHCHLSIFSYFFLFQGMIWDAEENLRKAKCHVIFFLTSFIPLSSSLCRVLCVRNVELHNEKNHRHYHGNYRRRFRSFSLFRCSLKPKLISFDRERQTIATKISRQSIFRKNGSMRYKFLRCMSWIVFIPFPLPRKMYILHLLSCFLHPLISQELLSHQVFTMSEWRMMHPDKMIIILKVCIFHKVCSLISRDAYFVTCWLYSRRSIEVRYAVRYAVRYQWISGKFQIYRDRNNHGFLGNR